MSDKPINFRKMLQQRVKGTHDSPCISVCTHTQGDVVCGGCGMLRQEKKGWKRRDEGQKALIRDAAAGRLLSLSDEKCVS